jgi:hypothetical protein
MNLNAATPSWRADRQAWLNESIPTMPDGAVLTTGGTRG